MARTTYDDVVKFAGKINWKPRGPWQDRIIGEITEHADTTLKGSRQTVGKTEAVSVVAATDIGEFGDPVGVGMPTLDQGGRIVVDRITRFLQAYADRANGPQIKPRNDSARYKKWENGGLLGAVSLYDSGDEMKGGSVQGYTFKRLLIDESHEAKPEVFYKLQPTLDTYAVENEASSTCMGVGGYPTSLIEVRFDVAGIHNIWVTPDELIKHDPEKYKPFFDKKRSEIPDHVWRQHYLCERMFAAGGQIFPYLPESVALGPNRHMEFGIDVGRSQDYTVVHALETDGHAANVIETLQLSGLGFPEQAKRVAEFIGRYMYLPHHVRVEKNTIGYGLWDSLVLLEGFANISAVFTSDSPPYFSKSTWIHELMLKARSGRLGVANERHRKELMNLMFEQNESGVYDWPHNDLLAGLWVWQARNHTVYAV